MDTEKPVVIVADDQFEVVRPLIDALTDVCTPIYCCTPIEVIEHIRVARVRAVVLDQSFGDDVNGLDIVPLIKAHGSDILVFLLSQHEDLDKDERMSMVDEYWVKGFLRDDLAQAHLRIKTALRRPPKAHDPLVEIDERECHERMKRLKKTLEVFQANEEHLAQIETLNRDLDAEREVHKEDLALYEDAHENSMQAAARCDQLNEEIEELRRKLSETRRSIHSSEKNNTDLMEYIADLEAKLADREAQLKQPSQAQDENAARMETLLAKLEPIRPKSRQLVEQILKAYSFQADFSQDMCHFLIEVMMTGFDNGQMVMGSIHDLISGEQHGEPTKSEPKILEYRKGVYRLYYGCCENRLVFLAGERKTGNARQQQSIRKAAQLLKSCAKK